MTAVIILGTVTAIVAGSVGGPLELAGVTLAGVDSPS
jgi:hypothetical protein